MTEINEPKCGHTPKIAADAFKGDLVRIIENIDLVDCTLNETRRVALGLLEQVESKENAEG